MQKLSEQFGTSRKALVAAALPAVVTVAILFGLAGETQTHGQLPVQSAVIPASGFEYEVASFKPNNSGSGNSRNNADGSGYTASNVTLLSLIVRAYGVRDFQVTGAPGWLSTEKYDVAAKMDEATADAFQKLPNDDRIVARQHMLQALLADRLKLVIRRDTRELPVYFLVIGKKGSKLKEATPGDTYPGGFKGRDGSPGTGFWSEGNGQVTSMTAQAVSIKNLAASLTGSVDRPVVDKTGLTGLFDFKLQWSPENLTANYTAGNAAVPDSSAPSIFAALQDQLGLKLQSGKGPVEIIVIDHVERPSEN